MQGIETRTITIEVGKSQRKKGHRSGEDPKQEQEDSGYSRIPKHRQIGVLLDARRVQSKDGHMQQEGDGPQD